MGNDVRVEGLWLDGGFTSCLLLQVQLTITINPFQEFSDVNIGPFNDSPVCLRHHDSVSQLLTLLPLRFKSAHCLVYV